MPVEFLTATQRDKLSRFPSEIPREDLIGRFSLREEDLDLIDTLQGGGASQLGFALQIAALRYLGFVISASFHPVSPKRRRRRSASWPTRSAPTPTR